MEIIRTVLIAAALCVIQAVSGRETVQDAAILARTLVDLSPSSIGTMATVFPDDHALAGQPFSLQEYYASCHTNGSLTLLLMPISRMSQNILHSDSRSVSISVMDAHPDASRPRVSLIGNVTIFNDVDVIPDEAEIKDCYIAKHPDARRWVPGPREPHVAYWARFDAESIYYVGGFGGLHYIGYIPMDLYQKASPARLTNWSKLATEVQPPSFRTQ
ncbi:hypothetical protein DAEQUDRAFT_724725 [Daedalea quercina L-15889]|uniref:CREG-like beta-barrel domain-containing protein n=1 Tax=Daedalea quercina L-15889 TaxID=1314783 RepID=A0A165RNJ9_9APHY|nr:hypothetical protein DAEQUDRAFT_724725 [Daedalea quercina L-15889]